MLGLCHYCQACLSLVLVLAAGVFAPGVARAQDGMISGTVTDATGGLLPGVTVDARDAVGNSQVTVTDGTGQFTFSGLAPGTYAVTFTLSGFTAPEQVVEVRGGATVALDVEMALGGIAEQVVVVGTRAQPRSVTASAVPIDVHPQRGFPQPGQYGPGRSVADRRPFVQHQHSTDQRRGDYRPAGEPAQLGTRSHADPGQRQAPPPRGGHYVARERQSRTARRARISP